MYTEIYTNHFIKILLFKIMRIKKALKVQHYNLHSTQLTISLFLKSFIVSYFCMIFYLTMVSERSVENAIIFPSSFDRINV